MDINGVPNVEAERVARYEYDGLPALDATQEGQGFRRIEKEVTANQGEGVVHHSDDGDITGILAGERHEHYYWGGLRGGAGVSPANWRLTETTNHVESAGSYSYADSDVLNQFVYGTQYIDEPVRYDRNTDVETHDDDCLDASGSAAYFYHQDANWRVVMLTDEDGDVVERVEYTAYGEPTVYLGYDSTAGAEMGNALLVSTVGNPLLHQGLFRDRETCSHQNRYRQYHSRSGRFMQRDPAGYPDGASLYAYARCAPRRFLDALGHQVTSGPPGWSPEKCAKKRQDLINLANKLYREIKQYDPATDQGGKKTSKKRGCKTTKPGGEHKKLRQKKRNFEKRVDDYRQNCPNDGPLPPTVPRTLREPIPPWIQPSGLWWLVDLLDKLPHDKTLDNIVFYTATGAIVVCTGVACYAVGGGALAAGALGGAALGGAAPALADEPNHPFDCPESCPPDEGG